MKKIIFLFFSILYFQSAFADMCRLTVIAESGLSLRKEPNLKSERLEVVKFGEFVLAQGNCDFSHPMFMDNIIEIDGIKGFWMKVRFNKTWGYMFSGYLVIGDLFPYSRTDTIDNVLMDQMVCYNDFEIVRSDTFNYQVYTPKLNWYGIKVNETSTSISKTKVKPIYNKKRWIKTNTDKVDVHLEVKNGEQFDFLFGTKKELSNGKIESKFHHNCENERGVFLYPEQEYSIDDNGIKYRFKAHEIVTIDDEQNISRTYSLKLFMWRNEIKIKDKDRALNLFNDGKIHAGYRNPMLTWSGNLNGDGYLDFIFQVSPMADKCGAFPFLIFLYSSMDKDGNVFYQANQEGLDFENFKKE